ncbi:a153.1 [Rat cytomegalovirus ALL-03]|uniref:A153.1 n=2 Tax=Rat cytomegalovirus (isolate England) TaxID=1261657 RepID=A0A0F6R592_RCMVE|nr:e153.1 [Murid betaherpesvirus 8]AKE44301.1 a153.1 [Rat cytomegalovirus ALL-03]AFX83451.1 e153.1 [Murid betaherpesvirus 8]WEG71924.1 membrane protein e148 [Murid betaherpesvirus 8]WPH25314.1 membrane protein e148 [Murid betaherpesvirus 8]WPH25447.1 membrane protein e148 [Murid betaherpesvirus 8]
MLALLLLLSVLSYRTSGRVDVYVDTTTKIDLCNSTRLILDVRRGIGGVFSLSLTLRGMRYLYEDMRRRIFISDFIRPEDVHKEMAFLRAQKDFMNRFVKDNLDLDIIYILRYSCDLGPFQCTVSYLSLTGKFTSFLHFDGFNVTYGEHWKDVTKTSPVEFEPYARGHALHLLQSNWDLISSKWIEICKRITVDDDPTQNVYIMRESSLDKFECGMLMNIPLDYTMFVHGDDVTVHSPVLQNNMYILRSGVINKPSDSSEAVCEIRSSTGWVVSVTRSEMSMPGPRIFMLSAGKKSMRTRLRERREDTEYMKEVLISTGLWYNMMIFCICIVLYILIRYILTLMFRYYSFDDLVMYFRLKFKYRNID